MPFRKRIVIIGGGYAGLIAANRIARAKLDADIVVVDAKSEFVQRIRMHQILVGDSPKALSYQKLLSPGRIGFLQAQVERIEVASERVTGRSADGRPLALGYDFLLVTSGSRTREPRSKGMLRLDLSADVQRCSRLLPGLSRSAGKVMVAGGGLTGIETSAELAERFPGLRVTLISRGQIGGSYCSAASHYLHGRLRELKVEIIEGVEVEHTEPGAAFLTGGTRILSDLCVWTAGFTGGSLARQAGIPVDASGRIVVDQTLRASGCGMIFAAGDAAAVQAPAGTLRMGCVTAMPMGARAGENIVRAIRGHAPTPFDFQFPGRNVSLGRKAGLIQFTDADDLPESRFLSGKAGAWVKEAVCRMTVSMIRAELRTGIPWFNLVNSDQRTREGTLTGHASG